MQLNCERLNSGRTEIQCARTFFWVVLVYAISVVPISLLNLIDAQIFAENPIVLRILIFLWYLQFSLNCYIYAIKSEAYREAYSYFLKHASDRMLVTIERNKNKCYGT